MWVKQRQHRQTVNNFNQSAHETCATEVMNSYEILKEKKWCMNKYLLESTFVLETQIFQAKKTFWMPLYSFISRAD